MEKEKLKEAVFINLRSVTQSAKGGILISRLQDDYKKWIGTNIPYQNLGYSTLEQFLQDIPHVVRLTRKGADGQLYVEAVTDASTAHLANLISKQKGATAKSSSASQKYGFRKTAISKKSTSSAVNHDEKDKIIADLRNSLEKERLITKNLSPDIIRLNSLVKAEQDKLKQEQEKVKKLEDQLQAAKKKEESMERSKDTEVYVKAINSLKSKLLDQENKSKVLSSRVNSLSDVNKIRIKNEKQLLMDINHQIALLLMKASKADSEVSSSLSSISATIFKRIGTLNALNNSLEAESEENVNFTNTSTNDSNNNTNILKLYAEQCVKIQNLENQLEQQNSEVKKMELKFEKQFQKLNAKVNTQSQESSGLKYTVAQLTGLFEVLDKTRAMSSNIFCQSSETEIGENNIKEGSSEISNVTAESILVSATKRRKKRKKAKVAEGSSLYVPPHRRPSTPQM